MDEHSTGRRESTSNLRACENYSTTEGLQLFNTIPALNEASQILAQTTSYFTSCFSGNVGLDEGQELITLTSSQRQGLLDVNQATTSGDVELDEGQELISLTSSQHQALLDVNRATTSNQCGDENTASINGNLAASSVGSSTSGSNEQLVSNSRFRNGSSIFKDLVDRARKTVRGSADDIGWLQKATDMPPVEDGTKRFLEILEGIRNNEHKLPNSVVYLLIPGLFSNHGPLYFVNTKTYFSKMGLACHIAKIHSEASVEINAREIKQYIEEISWGSRKRVLLLGHSKGGIDAAAALSLYWSDLKDKVAGLVLAQSPYGGSPIASDILREGQLGDYVSLRKMMEILICKVIKGDILALEDLTYERRKDFLRKYRLPEELPIVSFHTEVGITPSVLATMSHVAHAELPIPPLADGQPTKLPVIVPLGAAMAACAQLLQVRYGEKSDGLVTRRDAEVPGSVVVRPEQKLDHAWMVYSTSNNIDAVETDASKVCEALLTLLVEVAHKRRHEITNKDE